MSDSNNPDPKEREIYLRALRHYSESCEAPLLTPDCPFAVDVAPGERGCGEQCMDILAEQGAPPPVDEIQLSNGVAVRMTRRPRPRRPHSRWNRPYDGRAIFLDDQANGPPQRWHLSSLLSGLKQQMNSCPPEELDEAQARVDEIATMVSLVESRGLDFQLDVLPYLRQSMVGPVVGIVGLSALTTPPASSKAAEWAHLMNDLDVTEPPEPEMIGKILSQAIPRIIIWSKTASFEELRDWTAPGLSLIDDPTPARSLSVPSARGRWVTERFMETYLENWATSSLHLEWSYMHGQEPAPCLPSEMNIRSVSEDDLAKTIADRAVDSESPPQALTLSLIGPALDFIQDGRHIEAAGLFEAATRVEPTSADAHNNYGFCLLPIDPQKSLEALERSGELRGGDPLLNSINRVLCLAVQGHLTSAEDLARSTVAMLDQANAGMFFAWLWDPRALIEDGEAVAIESEDPVEYLTTVLKLSGASNFDLSL